MAKQNILSCTRTSSSISLSQLLGTEYITKMTGCVVNRM